MTAGIRGDFTDSCAVCLRGTDTGLGFVGEAEWCVAGMYRLGIPQNQAVIMVSNATGCDPGYVPPGRLTVPVRVCQPCAAKAGLMVALVTSGAELPAYHQPPE